MLSPQALFRGLVSTLLPSVNADSQNNDVAQRLDAFGGAFVQARIRKAHVLAREGSYFLANNAQTGIATGTAAVFAATTPTLIVQNLDSPGGKSIYFDYLALITTAAGGFASAGVNLQLVTVLDNGLRYVSGGTRLTANIVSPNMKLAAQKSVADIYFGALTASAATGAARTICGLRILRPAVSATVLDVIGELKVLNFGGVELTMNGSITVANANQIPHPLPPHIIGPQQSLLVYLLLNGTTPAAASYAPEPGWWEE